jgi:hypothetical protein
MTLRISPLRLAMSAVRQFVVFSGFAPGCALATWALKLRMVLALDLLDSHACPARMSSI